MHGHCYQPETRGTVPMMNENITATMKVIPRMADIVSQIALVRNSRDLTQVRRQDRLSSSSESGVLFVTNQTPARHDCDKHRLNAITASLAVSSPVPLIG